MIDEDVWAIEHQQRSLDAQPDVPMQSIPSDAPLIAMREIVGSMIAGEQSART